MRTERGIRGNKWMGAREMARERDGRGGDET